MHFFFFFSLFFILQKSSVCEKLWPVKISHAHRPFKCRANSITLSLYHIYLYLLCIFYYGHTHYGCFFCCFFFNTVSTNFPIPFSFECEFLLNVALPDTIFSRPRIFCTTWIYNRSVPFCSIPPICECGALTTDQMKCPVTLLCKPTPPRVLLCGDQHRPQSPSWLPQMIHLKCLAVRTPDSRHVNMNHATPAHGRRCLVCRASVVGTKWCPAACDLWWQRVMRPETHAGFLELCSAERPGSVTGQFYRNGLSKSVFFFLSLFFSKAQFKWVLLQRKKKILRESQRRSRRDICLHNHLTEHWDFQRNPHALPTHSVLPH